ncbi:hypothetical protein NDA11_006980 [Ustilago hordei]|nr:hypothetical protein NDA15_006928 [Ustilago hordei]KAJ1582751.1 hypothetical protein NDA12_002164 [Ustilago hordei]KAJ1588817.1 hypothetical protein NDA11_006980 [Ustilago hordei]
MLYVAHAYEPGAILETLSLPSFLPTGPCLAVVKHSTVEFLSLAASSSAGLLEPVQTVSLPARILAAQAVTSADSKQSRQQSLVILTDHYQPKLISLTASISEDTGEVVVATTATLALDEVARSPAESALGLWTEPFSSSTSQIGHRIAISHVYKGVLKVTPLSDSLAQSHLGATDDDDEAMQDVSQSDPHSRLAHFSHSFGARIPHPNLLSCAVLSPLSAASVPAVALLSLSSVPSKISGFGQQCLPVLSFHSVDTCTQNLSPLPWGPPRKAPRSVKEESDGKQFDPQSSSAATQASRDMKAISSDNKASVRKKHGPAAMGSKVTDADLQKREQDWAKSALVQCHVPLPYTDAYGAHLIHALPAHVGGGVLVFSETSILHVPPPANPPSSSGQADLTQTTTTPDAADLKGKRRKASEGGAIETKRRSLGAQSQPTPVKVETAATSSAPSNENGKRRRSSVNVPAPGAESSSGASAPSHSRPRLLRVGLPHPVQVVSVVDLGDRPDDKTFSVLFGCNSGALNVLQLTLPQDAASEVVPSHSAAAPQPKSMRVETLGTTSQPAGPQALSYLGDGLVCVGSATGDSCLYKILQQDTSEEMDTGPGAQLLSPPSSPTQSRRRRSSLAANTTPKSTELPCGGSLVTIETWQNLGPVVDFTVDDGAGGDPTTSASAQARIVTCSGAGPSGSIREVRSGASVQDVSSLPIPNAQQIWSVEAGDATSKQTAGLLIGFATSTAYLHFDANGNLADATDRLSAVGVDTTLPTLTASTVFDASQGPLLVRVAKDAASLVNLQDEAATLVQQWKPSAGLEITTASVNRYGQLVIASSDKSLSYLVVEEGALIERNKIQLDHEVSCLDTSSVTAGQAAQFAACGFWQTRSIQIFALPELAPVGESLVVQQGFAAVPRSILLHRFASKQSEASSQTKSSVGNRDALMPHLLIGLGDGTLVSFSLSLPRDDSYSKIVGLSDCKTVSLGKQALKLDAIESWAGARVVAVSGSRPTLVYADSKRFSYNALKHKSQRSVTMLHVGPGRVLGAFALAESVELASIGALRQRDIRTFPLGLDQPLAIAQWPNRKVFAVCTWAFLPRGSATKASKSRGAIRILDQSTFETLDEFRLEVDERPNCITVLRAQGHEMLVVGTGYISDGEHEVISGRLLGFDVSAGSIRGKEERGRLRKLFVKEQAGNVYSVQSINNRLATAVNSEVKIYSVVDPRASDEVSAPRINVVQRGSWACSFIACNLSVVEPDQIVVGDALRSINVLHVHPYTARLTEIARDCDPFWTSATELLDEASQTYIGADISFNLYTTQRVPLSEQVKARIRRTREREIERSVGEVNRLTTRDPNQVDRYAHVMQRNAVWHYGDMINKFYRKSLVADPGTAAEVHPRLLFCTAAGAIGVIAHVQEEQARLLAKVERNILSLIELSSSISTSNSSSVVTSISHQDWRTLRTDHRVQAPAGFLDANILQMFVDGRLDSKQRDKVVQGPNSEMEALPVGREIVEQLIEALCQLA